MLVYGIPVIEVEWAVEVVETRVLGGYMNHWLIRAFVKKPACLVTQDRIYIHPTLVPQLREHFRAAGPQLELSNDFLIHR